jgi:hypothetical protein
MKAANKVSLTSHRECQLLIASQENEDLKNLFSQLGAKYGWFDPDNSDSVAKVLGFNNFDFIINCSLSFHRLRQSKHELHYLFFYRQSAPLARAYRHRQAQSRKAND